MIRQGNQMTQIMEMDSKEFIKVVLAFCLFFIICILQLVDNSPKINELSKEGVKVPYPYYNEVTKNVDLNNEHPYRRSLNWWTQDFADITIPILLIVIFIIRPYLRGLEYMWLFYFVLIAIDRILFLGKWPFGFIIELCVLSIQLMYTFYCMHIWRDKY